MNRIIFFIFFFSLTILSKRSLSQGIHSYTYSVVDSSSLVSVKYVTLSIQSEKGIKKIVSNEEGKITVNLQSGSYILTYFAEGYSPKQIKLTVNDNNLAHDIVIKLTGLVTKLKEVAIIGSKPLVKREVDRLVYDVQSDEESKNMVMIDMLKKVPLLNVNADENITIQGKSNLKILLNGRPSALLNSKPADVLKSMAASGVARIEVVTVPPARYESEGLAGIINIVTVKRQEDGYSGSVNTSSNFLTDLTKRSLGAALNIRKNRFSLSTSTGISDERPKEDVYYERSVNLDGNKLIQTRNKEFKSPYNYLNAELSFEADSVNFFTGEFSHYRSKNDVDFLNTSFFNQGNIIDRNFSSNSFTQEQFIINSLGLNYEKTSRRNANQILSIAYRFNKQSDLINGDVNFSSTTNVSFKDFSQLNDQKASENTFQLEFTYPVKKVLIDMGAKMIFRKNGSDYNYINDDGSSTISSRFDNDQNVFSAFNSYDFSINKWKIKSGIRLENTAISTHPNETTDKVKFNFLNFSPSIAIQRQLSNEKSLNFGFTQRISRPSINDLNTFVDQSNPFVKRTGNPTLEPSIGNNLQISYSMYSKSSLDVGLNYSFQKNIIQKVETFDANSDITLIRYYNIGEDKSLGLNFYYKTTFAKKITLTINNSISYVWIKGLIGDELSENRGLYQYYNVSLLYNIKKGLRLTSDFEYEKPRINLQSTIGSNFSSSFVLNKDFFNRKITAGLSVINLFAKYRNFITETYGANFIESSNTQLYYRRFNLKVTYRFGKLKNDLKHTKKSIENNDLSH